MSDPPAETEALLIARSRRGGRSAFEELVRRTARLVYARAVLETGDRHRAEDLVQETFLLAWQKINQVAEPAGFRPWLLTILHSCVVDSARREGRKKRSGTRAADDKLSRLPAASPAPNESAATREERERALSVLRSLPEEYRQVLTLRYLAGADYETI